MLETRGEVDALQALLDRSVELGGPHMAGSVTPGHRVSAQ